MELEAKFCRNCNSYQNVVLRHLPHASLGLSAVVLCFAFVQFLTTLSMTGGGDQILLERNILNRQMQTPALEVRVNALTKLLEGRRVELRVGLRTWDEVVRAERDLNLAAAELEVNRRVLVVLEKTYESTKRPLYQRWLDHLLGRGD
jgi:hypothetical protein